MLLLRLLRSGFESVVSVSTAVTVAVLVVSIFLSGDGSAERTGLFVFLETVGLLAVVCLLAAACLARASLLTGVVLSADEAEEEEDQEEEREEDEEETERDLEPLLELLAEELEKIGARKHSK